MTQTYHFKKGMMKLGPYGLEHMRDLVRQSAVGRSHQVSIDGGASLLPAVEFPELFVADPKPEVAPGKEEIDEGPTDDPPIASAEWYYSQNGQRHDRAVSESELHHLIRLGSLKAGDRVWTAEFGETWRGVEEVPQLAMFLVRDNAGTTAGTRRKRRRSEPADTAAEFNVPGVIGFICALVAVVLLTIPCLVWLLIAQSFFWVFNIVIPLGVLAIVGLTMSVIGLQRPRRGLATAGAVLGVIAVSMAAMGIVGSATIRYRLATLRRVQIDTATADIELVKKSLADAMTFYRNLRRDEAETEEQFALREEAALREVAARLRDLGDKYDTHLTATASTSEFRQAFEDGVPALRKALQDVQQAATQRGFALADILPEVNANTDRLKLLMDTLSLYEKGKLTLPQVEGKMTGR